jgi:NAD(P)H-quinone oxidoreductase subunit 4L
MIPELIIALSASALMFGIGIYGALSQTNLVMIIMGVEMVLAAAMLNMVAFWRYLHPDEPAGQMFVLIIMAIMAVEMAVGFGVAIARFRSRGSVEMEEADRLKG